MYINLNPALFLAKFKTGLNSRPDTIANPAKPFLFPVITILRIRFERPIELVIIDIGLAYSIQLSNPSKVSKIEDIEMIILLTFIQIICILNMNICTKRAHM